ncbi:MAG: SpoIID/LytB domain-containing protein [Lachnospiraceae bacterium]|nr:SpoIID/LytB domain-containing protein [Lachnospiraceae bacterium]
MREKIKNLVYIVLILIGLPLVVTLLFQGKELLPEYEELSTEQDSVQEEDLLPVYVGILAKQMPADYEEEALKAQAVLVRTNYAYALANGKEVEKGYTMAEQQELLEQENYSRYYGLLESCVRQTAGQVLCYQGELIECPFFSVSAGMTRGAQGGQEYLQSVDSGWDMTSEDFLHVMFYDKEDFLQECLLAYPECGLTQENLSEQFSVTDREDSGYVKTVQLGNISVDGEELRNVFSWDSAAFTFREVDDKIRIVTKGLGHGYGMSLYGANELAKDGKSYEEILHTYFTGITIENE